MFVRRMLCSVRLTLHNIQLPEKPLASHALCSVQDANQDTVTWHITWAQYTASFDETRVGGKT